MHTDPVALSRVLNKPCDVDRVVLLRDTVLEDITNLVSRSLELFEFLIQLDRQFRVIDDLIRHL